MNKKLLSWITAVALGAMLALTPPVFARGGGGMHGGGMGGGWHGGGMGGGWHGGGMGGGWHGGGMGGAWHGGGTHFSNGQFGGGHFAHAGFSPGFSRFAFRNHHAFFHHRFHRFAFVGFPYTYAAYDDCWRRTWTSYGPQWVNVCSGYDYY
jgi:hypothetical protein